MKRRGGDLRLRQAKKPRLDCERQLNITGFLPPEVVQHILKFIEEDQKTNLRLVSPTWCSLINKSYFRIGCILPTEIEDVVENFNNYSQLIGLRFDKTYKLSADDIAPLFTLTNLSSLEIYPIEQVALKAPFNHLFSEGSNLQPQILALSQVFVVDEGCLTNLTKLVTGDLSTFHGRMSSQLVSLQATTGIPWDLLNNNLTHLETDDNTELYLHMFSHLKSFHSKALGTYNFSKNSKLESINVRSTAVKNAPPTVTSLTVSTFKPHMLKESSTLRRLVAQKGDALPGLIGLESLEIKVQMALGGMQQLKEMPLLKELSIRLLFSDQISCLQGLHSLQSLNIHYEYYSDAVNMEPLMALTRLTALQISSFTKVFGLANVSNLTNLKQLRQHARFAEEIPVASIYALKNLTSLAWKSPMKFYTANMTYLRELHLSPEGNQVASFNLHSVSSLAISVENTNYFWRCTSSLSSLRELTLYNLTDGTRLFHLTSLRHLTLLRSLNNRCPAYTITALTRLQHFVISPPANWSDSFKREISAKLPYLKDYLMSISPKID